MKVYIQCDVDGLPYNKNCFAALEGFRYMGFEIVRFQSVDQLSGNIAENVVVGGISVIQKVLNGFGINASAIDYPHELKAYLQRNIWQTTSDKLASLPLPVFIKSVEGKQVTGFVCHSQKDLIGRLSPYEKIDILCSDVVSFIAEFRCYIRYAQILDIKRYKGVLNAFYDYAVIENAVKDYHSAPAGYSLDFGVTDEGKTVLVEVNEGYSLGNYGLDSLLYAKLLSARWAQLTNTKDWCDF